MKLQDLKEAKEMYIEITNVNQLEALKQTLVATIDYSVQKCVGN